MSQPAEMEEGDVSNTWFHRLPIAIPLVVFGCTSNDASSSGTSGGSGGTVTSEGSGGGSAVSGGTAGETLASTGGSKTSGGTSSGSGGSTETEIAGAESGGTTSTGGRAGADTGGTTGTTGGSTGTTGGAAVASGGTMGATAGTTGTTGGATGATAGTTGTTGGATGATGGTTDTSGGSTSTGSTNSTDVTVHLDQTKQTMDGFGISDIWASTMTEAEADALFDPTRGLGLSILRVGMGPDGDPMSDNIYSDIAKASARGVETFIGTVWSAPSECMASDSEDGGEHLLESCYDSWAESLAAFPGKVKQNTDVDLYAMSAQNEPDFCGLDDQGPCSDDYPTMLFTAEQMVAFVKVLGPKLRALNPPVKVIAPEVSEWVHLWTNDSAPGSTNPLGGNYDYGHALAEDADAWTQVDIVGTHQYDTQVAEPWPDDVPQAKSVWMTEMSGVKGWPEQGPSSDIDNGIAVAGWIHDALTVGEASAWCWWWYRTQGSTNEGLTLSDGTDTKRHYTLGNFSRFIRPGYTRLAVTGNVPVDVLLSAYRGSDGTVVVVSINKGSAMASVPIAISGGTAPASLTPWVTSASEDLAAKTAVTVSGGSFTATLDGKTVTTFVGK